MEQTLSPQSGIARPFLGQLHSNRLGRKFKVSSIRAVTHQQICGDQDPAGPRPELSHDDVSLLLLHVTMLGSLKLAFKKIKVHYPYF